jgi:PIN domain nuclease of toxin-antitoxin system
VIVLDTHALLWWALDPDQLSPRAAELCAQMERDGGFASAISIWELGIKVKTEKLDLGMPVSEFVRRLQVGAVVELIPVDATIWLRTVQLPWDHRDPADRVIVATALEKGLPVLSKDEVIQGFAGGRWLW